MALRNCPECGGKVSSHAPICPGCGAPQLTEADIRDLKINGTVGTIRFLWRLCVIAVKLAVIATLGLVALMLFAMWLQAK